MNRGSRATWSTVPCGGGGSVMGSRVTQIYVKVKSLQLGHKFAELGFVNGRKWRGD